ncbi:MAG: hypothetical protein R6V55_13670 [Desulfovermiculus sp.]
MKTVLLIIMAVIMGWVVLFHSNFQFADKVKKELGAYSQFFSQQDRSDQAESQANATRKKTQASDTQERNDQSGHQEQVQEDSSDQDQVAEKQELNYAAYMQKDHTPNEQMQEQLKEIFYQSREEKGLSRKQSQEIWNNLEQTVQNLRAPQDQAETDASKKDSQETAQFGGLKKK